MPYTPSTYDLYNIEVTLRPKNKTNPQPHHCGCTGFCYYGHQHPGCVNAPTVPRSNGGCVRDSDLNRGNANA